MSYLEKKLSLIPSLKQLTRRSSLIFQYPCHMSPCIKAVNSRTNHGTNTYNASFYFIISRTGKKLFIYAFKKLTAG